MNILLVMPFSLSDVGGVSAAVRMLSCEFAKAHQVDVLLEGESNRVRALEHFDGIPVSALRMRSPSPQRASLSRSLLSFALFLPLTLFELHRFLKRQQTDVVLIQYPLPWGVYFAILRWFSRWKLVVTYQGNDAHDVPLWTRREQRCIEFLLSSSDSITFVSRSLLDKLSAFFPALRKDKTVIIPNGAPLDLLSQGSIAVLGRELPQKCLVTVGHLVHRKGIDVLFAALKIASDQGQVMDLVVLGDGPERESLTNLSLKLGVSQNVHFWGSQPHEVVLSVLKESLFFVLASRAEGLPLVIAEAMACGKAVVATNVDGAPEIVVEGRTGLLVETENAHDLAEALIKVYRDSELRERFGREGKKRAKEVFAWESIAIRYLQLFQQLQIPPSYQTNA